MRRALWSLRPPQAVNKPFRCSRVTDSKRKAFTMRAALLGVLLSVIYSCVNMYLNINFGWGFNFGTLTILFAYLLFRKGDSSRKLSEMGVAMTASVSGLTMGFTMSLLIYLRENLQDQWIPEWLIPSHTCIATKSLAFSEWMVPIAFLLVIAVATSLLGFLFALMTREAFLSDERLIFPSNLAPATLAESTLKGGKTARIAGLFVLAGATVTFLQYGLKIFGVEATEVDMTRLLPQGFIFAVTLSLGFVAIGYIISARVSLSILGAGLVTYSVLAPISISQGLLPYSRDTMETYNAFMMRVAISPVLGMLILGGITLSIFSLLRGWLKGKRTETTHRVGYIELYRVFFSNLVSDRRVMLVFLGLLGLLFSLTYALNPFHPFPPHISVLFFAYMLLIGNFLEFIIIARMQGEAGMGTGAAGTMLYDVPKFLTGYRGITAYFALNSNAQWTGSSLMGHLKTAGKYRLSIKDVIKSMLITWIPTYVATMALVLVLWKYVGFFTPAMPSISLLQAGVLYKMLATGTAKGVIDPVSFILGALIGTILEAATPVSMFGVALGMILPPHYFLIFGIGGALRLYLDKKHGSKFFWEKGIYAASGLLAGSMIVQVFMMIILKLVWQI